MKVHSGFAPRVAVRQGLALAALLLAGALPAGRAAAQTTEPYRIGVGDKLDIIVVGELDLTTPPPGLEVGPDGRIGVPYAGMIVAQGKTCEEVAAAIAEAVRTRHILVKPEVIVRVDTYNAQKVNVLGAVHTPLSYPYHPALKIRDAIALAGGVNAEAGVDPAYMRGQLVHSSGQAQAFDVQDALNGVGKAGAIELKPGDTLVLEEGAFISVLGYVGNPGFIRVQGSSRLSEVIAKVGGPQLRTDEGDLTNITINRADGKVEKVNLQPALQGKGGSDPLIAPGDVVYVPRSECDANILGYVVAPGKYSFHDGDRVSDLLAQARGPSIDPSGIARGDLSRMTLSRQDGSVRTLDFSKLPPKGAPDDVDPVLRPGDNVAIPETQCRVIVAGYVRNPGYYPFRPGDTVGVVIASAGGVLPNIGSESAIQVQHRDGTAGVAQLAKDTLALQPGDQISVPFARHRVAVLGFVNRPGVYDFQEGDTVAEALANAGGPLAPRAGAGFNTQMGNLFRVLLLRRENGQDKVQDLDLRPFYTKGDRSVLMPVQAGDVLLVPGKSQFDWERVLRDVVLIPRLLGF